MAKYLFEIISCKSEDTFDPPFGPEGTNDAFLHVVIQPIFNVMQKVCVEMLYHVYTFFFVYAVS